MAKTKAESRRPPLRPSPQSGRVCHFAAGLALNRVSAAPFGAVRVGSVPWAPRPPGVSPRAWHSIAPDSAFRGRSAPVRCQRASRYLRVRSWPGTQSHAIWRFGAARCRFGATGSLPSWGFPEGLAQIARHAGCFGPIRLASVPRALGHELHAPAKEDAVNPPGSPSAGA